MPLYRILEGYILWPRCAQEKRRDRQLQVKRDAERRAKKETGWRRGLALEKLANYPMHDDQVVPTRFGNAIRAFETYGKTRFNLDALTLWYELCAVVPKYVQNEIESTKASVDFFVASFYLSLVFGLSTLIIGVWEDSKSLLIFGLLAFVVTFVSYQMALKAIDSWRRAAQALVNTGRIKLAETLGLSIPKTLSEEKAMWGLVTSYVYYADARSGAKLDQYRKQNAAESQRAPPRRR